jgi:hypothetical protein
VEKRGGGGDIAEEGRGEERSIPARRCHKFVEKEAGTGQGSTGRGLAWNRTLEGARDLFRFLPLFSPGTSLLSFGKISARCRPNSGDCTDTR